jgi:DNA-binding CsgD family transcriptional regulator
VGHVLIFTCVVNLVVGAWVAFTIRLKLVTLRVPVLRCLLHYVVFFNVSIFVFLVMKYVLTNLLAEEASAAPSAWLVVAFWAGFCVEIGLSFTLVQVAYASRERRLPPLVPRCFTIAAGFFGVGFVVGTTTLVQGGDLRWLAASYGALATCAVAVIVTFLVILAFAKHSALEPEKQRAARWLGRLLLSGWVLLVLGSSVPEPASVALDSLVLLWLNLGPLVWLRTRFAEGYAPAPAAIDSSALEVMSSQYQITTREREIIELILQGLSNKEIEEKLFISFNTVKNHIYNIYRKLGVSSRGQLTSLFMRTQAELARSHEGQDRQANAAEGRAEVASS